MDYVYKERVGYGVEMQKMPGVGCEQRGPLCETFVSVAGQKLNLPQES